MLRNQRPCEEILILLSFGEALYLPPPHFFVWDVLMLF